VPVFELEHPASVAASAKAKKIPKVRCIRSPVLEAPTTKKAGGARMRRPLGFYLFENVRL
jgi:hypothetical protein